MYEMAWDEEEGGASHVGNLLICSMGNDMLYKVMEGK